MKPPGRLALHHAWAPSECIRGQGGIPGLPKGRALWNWQAFRAIARLMSRPVAAVILAAGKGTRMKSDLHKVLHPIAGRPMIAHLLASVAELQPARTVVVVGDKAEQVEPVVRDFGGVVALQEPQHGTGHAVQQAEAALAGFNGDV